MYIGVSLFLIAAGAIFAWAVDVDWESFDLNLAGYIIFGVGILALIISFIQIWMKKRAHAAASQKNAPRPSGPSGPTTPGAPGATGGPGTPGKV